MSEERNLPEMLGPIHNTAQDNRPERRNGLDAQVLSFKLFKRKPARPVPIAEAQKACPKENEQSLHGN